MLILILLFIIGIGLGAVLRRRQAMRPWADGLTRGVVCALMLVLGISVGSNPEVMQNLAGLGLQALVLTVGATAGSILAVRLMAEGRQSQ